MKQLKNKYNAKKTTVDGITFDSRKEAKRYTELKFLEKSGEITNLSIQPEYEICPRWSDGKKTHRRRVYRPDFKYNQDGKVIVEDVKGGKATITEASSLRMAIFRQMYQHIELRLV